MNLCQALRLSPSPHFSMVGFVGSGGKTIAMFQLARQLPPPVIVTATTHMHIDQIKLADSHWIVEKPEDLAGLEKNLHGVMLITGLIKGTRTTGVDSTTLSRLRTICDTRNLPMLIEADGSRQRPLKAPAIYEPPIPDFVETVLVVTGLSGLGKPLTEEFVHRPEIFARLSGLDAGETISPQALLQVLMHPAGGLKNIPPRARRIVILNQTDTPEIQAQAKAIAENLLMAYQAVVIASLGKSRIHAVYEPVAGIILAGGESKRFGLPKQLLEYRGQPFVRTVTQTALAGGLSPVVVVSGANAAAVEAAVQDLPITITRNVAWKNGQSSSIKTGLQAIRHPAWWDSFPKSSEVTGVREYIGAAIFLLADQPQTTTTIIRALVEQHRMGLSPIVAPLVAGQRTNPALFDCVTFPDLMALSGDVGGRAIFRKYQVTYLPWHDESLLLDVDTPMDLERLRNREY